MASDEPELPFKHNMVNGIPVPTFINQQRMDELKDFSLRGGDLFIATYPKSGTTWTRQIVRLILKNGEDDGKILSKSVPWLSAGRPHPQVCFGSWFEHVLEWWRHKDDPNILFLKYEDMQKDHPGAVRAIAEFMGCDLTPDVVDKIVKESTIDKMKANPNTNFSWVSPNMFAVKEINPFLRKGIVGDWKNHFTAEQSAMFDAVYQEKMKGTGLSFEFELI